MIPKPEPRARVKARRKRQEARVKEQVRHDVFVRESFRCRISDTWLDTWLVGAFGDCDGPLEWAHLGDHRRFKTRGMPPEKRHTTAGSLCMCKRHHGMYDRHQLKIEPMTSRGADGPMTFTAGDRVYMERE